MSTRNPRRQRRRRYYFEIHLGGGRVVSGRQLWAGMLDAVDSVEARAAELSDQEALPQRGYMIALANRIK